MEIKEIEKFVESKIIEAGTMIWVSEKTNYEVQTIQAENACNLLTAASDAIWCMKTAFSKETTKEEQKILEKLITEIKKKYEEITEQQNKIMSDWQEELNTVTTSKGYTLKKKTEKEKTIMYQVTNHEKKELKEYVFYNIERKKFTNETGNEINWIGEIKE